MHHHKLCSVLALVVLAALLTVACGTSAPVPTPVPAQGTQAVQSALPTSVAQPAQPQAAPSTRQPAVSATVPAIVVPGMDLGGKTWQWVKTLYNDGKTFNPTNPANYTIAFSMSDGKVAIKADCNNANGDFLTDGQNLEIVLGAATLAQCPPGSLSDEYLKELSQVGSYKVDGNTLYLYFMMDSGTMTLTSGQAAAQAAQPGAPTTQPGAPTAQPAAPTAQPAAPTVGLGGQTWKWLNTAYNNGTTVTAPDPNKYTLTFQTDKNRFIFVSDCNNGSGSFTLNGQQLAMTVEGMTRAFCPPPSDDYIQQLGQVASYGIEGNTLHLALKSNAGTMTFTTGQAAAQPAQPAPTPAAGSTPSSGSSGSLASGPDVQRLTSGVWKWVKSIDNSGKDWTPTNPANYTVQFNPVGTVAIKADCNNASGTYKTNDSNLTIVVGPMTMAACPPPTLSNEFVQQLGQAGSYFFDGNALIIEWQMDSGSMRFEQ